MGGDWEAVIGLEVHVQLRTAAKLFSSAPNAFGGEPNAHTTEVDLGLPGVLPVLNARAVELALRAGVALGCEIQPVSRFERKHYFYPDLPKGYQISQYQEPYAVGGTVPVQLDGTVHEVSLTRIHMEEDAAKSVHDGAAVSRVDLNRAGVPLLEIVTEPELRSPEEAGAYLRSLRSILRYLDVSDVDLEKGHFRCDANVSLRPRGAEELGVKVELKNLNSFRHVERGLAYEIVRQAQVLDDGGHIVQETRHWDERAECTVPARSKEYADDYRYFPDPDLVPLRVEPGRLERIAADLPELPHQRRARFEREHGLTPQAARVLTEEREVADFFEAAVRLHPNARQVANWVMREVLGAAAETGRGLGDLKLSPEMLARLLDLVEAGRVTPASAREVLGELAERGGDPEAIVRERGLEAVSDAGELEALAREVVDAHPDQVAQYRAGEKKVFNFLIGRVMRRTRGKASPDAVRAVLARLLDA